jgi:glycosyltransferase involved in cell wall biosynthesis
MGNSTKSTSVGCIVPARNEAGHLREVINHVLSLSAINQIVIVEGHSNDDTYEVALQIAKKHPSIIRVVKQTGKGKFNAVLEGSRICKSDFLLIWDADGTISSKDSRRIIESAITSGAAATGNRLLGNMQKGSMRFANKIGNWLFALLWSGLLFRSPIDLLCGTKIFPRVVFDSLPAKLVQIDPYGDFALLANAKYLNIPIHSITVDYDARKYGKTNIKRWSGGVRLLIATAQISIWIINGRFLKK